MIERKRYVTMKGHRGGLAVYVNERCSVDEFLDDLELTLTDKSVENGTHHLLLRSTLCR